MAAKGQDIPDIGMLSEHRKCILENIENLVNATNYEVLKTECKKEKLLSNVMVNKIEAVRGIDDHNEEALRKERHRRLFRKITKRGPDAFGVLKNILERKGFYSALMYLVENYMSLSEKKKISNQIIHNPATISSSHSQTVPSRKDSDEKDKDDNHLELKRYTGEICPRQHFEVIKSTEIRGGGTVPAYQMESKHNRGVLLLVNIIEFANKDSYRQGAIEDSQSLLMLFKELGFKLYSYHNLTQNQFTRILKLLLESDDVRNTECFVMAIMSHGKKVGTDVQVQFTDETTMRESDILEYFSDGAYKNLSKVPKIILFPFCRGEQKDFGRNNIQTDIIRTMPKYTDTAICYATPLGYSSHRDTEKGSWYIQCFCKLMAKHAHDTAFDGILKLIQKETSEIVSESGSKQEGSYINHAFNNDLFFNPGVYKPCDGTSDPCEECARKKN